MRGFFRAQQAYDNFIPEDMEDDVCQCSHCKQFPPDEICLGCGETLIHPNDCPGCAIAGFFGRVCPGERCACEGGS